ncbi:glycoside hydrolase family 140 protein [Algoriphagus yeomjeoni]|uniref:glycoside hydrolase family 140 protein n=1 Tax=Algoriphagus yeomjeoni TaxID=291403 RepID=UPI003CE467C9
MKRIIGLVACLFTLLTLANAQELKITPNGRYFETQKGEPFFWLGDTAWELFHRLNKEEAKFYLQTRAKQGFTVIQAVILAERDGVKTPNSNGDLPFHKLDPTQPNEAYFEHVDFIIEEANKLGLTMGVLPTWGDKIYSAHPGAGPLIFDVSNAKAYGRFLGERYRNSELLWILGGDRMVANEEVAQIWDAMAEGLEEGDEGRHLTTYHPRGFSSSSDALDNPDWLDFNMYQSGHEKRFLEVYRFARKDLALRPQKPTVEGEPAYEDIPVKFWNYMKFKPGEFSDQVDAKGNIKDQAKFPEGFFSGYDVRVLAYWNILAGAAGYTYGNNAVWQMQKEGETFVIPTLTDWKGALKRPGAESMKFFKKFFEAIDFTKIVSDQKLILSENPENEDQIRAAIANDGSYVIAYLAKPREVKVDLTELTGDKLHGIWYNPRNGKKIAIKKLKPTPSLTFQPPTSGVEEDWVLLIQDKDQIKGK